MSLNYKSISRCSPRNPVLWICEIFAEQIQMVSGVFPARVRDWIRGGTRVPPSLIQNYMLVVGRWVAGGKSAPLGFRSVALEARPKSSARLVPGALWPEGAP